MRLIFFGEVEAEIEATRQYYALQGRDAYVRLLEEISHALRQIREAPFAWAPYSRSTRRYLLKRFPYYLIYRVTDEDIYIIAFGHVRRDSSYWHNRLDLDKV